MMSGKIYSLGEAIDELAPKISEGKAVSFLGAGASAESGGPLWERLTAQIKEHFPKVEETPGDFSDICTQAAQLYSLDELRDFIRNRLDTLQPSDGHKILVKYKWSAIFTTNYDDLIERAYNSPSRNQRAESIYINNPIINRRSGKVFIYKLMGCIRETQRDDGAMVLTRAEYLNASTVRSRYFQELHDTAFGGTILYIGYSFKDRVVRDVLEGLELKYKRERWPWSWAFFRSDESIPRDFDFNKYRIYPVIGSFCEFFRNLEGKYPPHVKISIPKEKVNVKLRDLKVKIEREKILDWADQFSVMHEELFDAELESPEDFFRKRYPSWKSFEMNWDFERSTYPQLREKIIQASTNWEPSNPNVFLITGGAGAGKSRLLRRLAYDLYRGEKLPVIWLETTRVDYDFKLLWAAADKIGTGESVVYIFVDDAVQKINIINFLKNYLISRGTRIILVLATRRKEWGFCKNQANFKILDSFEFDINDQLTDVEVQSLINHAHKLGFIKHANDKLNTYISEKLDRSVFATFYTFIYPTRIPLEEIIQQSYSQLTPIGREICNYIALTYRFNLPLKHEHLVRVSELSFTEFEDWWIQRKSPDLLYDYYDENGNRFFHLPHRIFAEKILRKVENVNQLYLKLFTNANLSNELERELCKNILIQNIGHRGIYRDLFDYDARYSFFRAMTNNTPLRLFKHHWGLLMSDEAEKSDRETPYEEVEPLLLEAEKHLEDALDIEEEPWVDRAESDQNILVSLGTLYSQWARTTFSLGNSDLSNELHLEAEKCFEEARRDVPNGHAYHAHAFMLLRKAGLTSVKEEKLQLLSDAWSICIDAEHVLNPDEVKNRELITELKVRIADASGNLHELERAITRLKEKYNSGAGYLLVANRIIFDNEVSQVDEQRNIRENKPYWTKRISSEKKGYAKQSLNCLEEGLRYFPDDKKLNELYARITVALYPNDTPKDLNERYRALLKWKANEPFIMIDLQYQLARDAFCLEDYEKSEPWFEELLRVSTGNQERAKPRAPMQGQHSRPLLYEGQLMEVPTYGLGNLRCLSLEKRKKPIVYSPIRCNFAIRRNLRVKFQIAFNFWGPFAIELSRD